MGNDETRPLAFVLTARQAQCPPPGDWRGWLALGGRGSGKTRAGAEWTRVSALFGGCGSIALIGPTLHDVRETMIDGVSGLCRISRPGEEPPAYEASRRRLVWPNGAVAQAFSAEDPDSLRGPQFDAAWCDEAGAWRQDIATWDMLQLGLRLGRRPRSVITTTPRRTPLIRRLMSDADISVTRSSTRDNAGFLSPVFLAHIEASLGGTQLGRQELEGEFIDVEDGVFWTRAMLEAARAGALPDTFADVVVAVDPPVSIGADADACGLVAAGTANAPGGGAHFWLIEDATIQGCSPNVWAQAGLWPKPIKAVSWCAASCARREVCCRYSLSMPSFQSRRGPRRFLPSMSGAGCPMPGIFPTLKTRCWSLAARRPRDRRTAWMPSSGRLRRWKVPSVGSRASVRCEMI